MLGRFVAVNPLNILAEKRETLLGLVRTATRIDGVVAPSTPSIEFLYIVPHACRQQAGRKRERTTVLTDDLATFGRDVVKGKSGCAMG